MQKEWLLTKAIRMQSTGGAVNMEMAVPILQQFLLMLNTYFSQRKFCHTRDQDVWSCVRNKADFKTSAKNNNKKKRGQPPHNGDEAFPIGFAVPREGMHQLNGAASGL